MNEQQTAPEQETTINGVPLSELPDLCKELFKKVTSLAQEERDLAVKHAQKKLTLEEIANMLAAEVEQFKAARETVETSTVS